MKIASNPCTTTYGPIGPSRQYFFPASLMRETPVLALSPSQTAQASLFVYQLAFEGYQAYTHKKIDNWNVANDNAGRFGSWR